MEELHQKESAKRLVRQPLSLERRMKGDEEVLVVDLEGVVEVDLAVLVVLVVLVVEEEDHHREDQWVVAEEVE